MKNTLATAAFFELFDGILPLEVQLKQCTLLYSIAQCLLIWSAYWKRQY